MKISYRVRFVGGSKYQKSLDTEASAAGIPIPHPPAGDADKAKPRRTKSRSGCKECRTRRVKCDETYPVCLRCQRRGSICRSATRPVQWHTEMPWLSHSVVLDSWTGHATPNKRLVQFWIEQTSHMMALDRNNNPLSLPLLQYLAACPSLLHAVQSVSAGHETFFSSESLRTCLEERGLALKLLREEVQDPGQMSISSMLTVFVLGVSSPWIELRPNAYGKEHLDGARALIKHMLSHKRMREDSLAKFLLGWYLYWDMSSSFLDTTEGASRSEADDIVAVLHSDDCFHPMIGFSSELYALVATVGRHCRWVLENETTLPGLEQDLRDRLLAWQPGHHDKHLVNLSLAYRNHGILMLYRTCETPVASACKTSSEETQPGDTAETECAVRSLVLESICMMLKTPLSEPCANFQSLPLLSAGAELMSTDEELRNNVKARFKGLYSSSRVMVNMWAIELLEELWDLHDCGVNVSWIDLCTTKGWNLCFS
ncbi:fungal-specific transcription factor domain-containing protein [Thelonectria olida]|uniref:Fungal-specific transcription factor domain-containing protein n=1 Tax=Thelonectria olida TaxID=1576542 RepID=A0A9P8VRK4_9HYPO|nr:fungal-specific transcription factor domain-containing protein [Thelonectria olida]